MIKFLNLSEQLLVQRPKPVYTQLNVGRSTFYKRISDGLFPPPFSLGDRAVAFYQHETNAIIRAMAAGCSKEEIRELVQLLIEYRESPIEFVKKHQEGY